LGTIPPVENLANYRVTWVAQVVGRNMPVFNFGTLDIIRECHTGAPKGAKLNSLAIPHSRQFRNTAS